MNVSRKVSGDLAWNVASVAIMAIVGLLLNVLISHFYNVSTLGVYSLVYSLYLVLSQLAVGGVHLSVLKRVAELPENSEDIPDIFTSGLVLTALIAAFFTGLAYLGKDLFGLVMHNHGVTVGITVALPGLFFFSLNKVYLGLANGRRQMKAFAVFQALRYLFMLGSLLLIIYLKIGSDFAPALFSIAEIILFILLVIYFWREVRFRKRPGLGEMYRSHWKFGLKAMAGNLLLNTYNKMDVLILGLFASSQVVGIYSFASMVVEGYNQLSLVLRNNLNPILAREYAVGGAENLVKVIARWKKLAILAVMPVGVVAVAAFPLVMLFKPDPLVMQGWGLFAILMLGSIISQPYQMLAMILNQTGFPGWQTILIVVIFGTCVGLNFALSPVWGMFGAAIATCIAYVMQIVYIRSFTRALLKVSI
jgi:O-antigen/teichoic acid export membrane protein